MATDSFGVSGRAMLEALIAGQRDPKALAELARGRLRVKHAALVEALTGQFTAHHALVARMLLDQIDPLDEQIQQLTAKLEQTITQLPAANPPAGGPGAASGPPGPVPGHAERVDPTPGRSWPRPCRRWTAWTKSPGSAATPPRSSSPSSGWTWAHSPPPHSWGRGPGWHPAPSSPAPNSAPAPPARARSERPPPPPPRPTPSSASVTRRLVRRIGKRNALVAIARSILVIVWHLLADPTARFHDLGADYSTRRIDKTPKTRKLLRQLQALGHQLTLEPAA